MAKRKVRSEEERIKEYQRRIEYLKAAQKAKEARLKLKEYRR